MIMILQAYRDFQTEHVQSGPVQVGTYLVQHIGSDSLVKC